MFGRARQGGAWAALAVAVIALGLWARWAAVRDVYYGQELLTAVYWGDADVVRALARHRSALSFVGYPSTDPRGTFAVIGAWCRAMTGSTAAGFGGFRPARPLIWAMRLGMTTVVGILLSSGADPNARDEGGNPVIRECHSAWDAAALLAYGASPDARDSDGDTLMLLAAGWGSMNLVDVLLAHGADVSASNQGGRTPLHQAVGSGSLAVVKRLIQAGASPVARDKTGQTPLHWAARYGSLAVVQCLVRAGAPPAARDNKGRTPLALARDAQVRRYLTVAMSKGGTGTHP